MSLSYLPGTASLLEELDKKLMVLLRDGRTLIGEQLNTPNGLFLSILSQQNVNLGKNKPRISETDLTKMFFVRLPPFC